jgi:hypothetical protein
VATWKWGVVERCRPDCSARRSVFSLSAGGRFGKDVLLVARYAGKGAGWIRPAEVAGKAANNVGDFKLSAKHLPDAKGRYRKFANGVDPYDAIAKALKSDNAEFLPNLPSAQGEARFAVRTDLGTQVGTKGETAVRVVVSWDSRIVTAYPVK